MFGRCRFAVGFVAMTLLALVQGCANDTAAPARAPSTTAQSARSVTTLEPTDLGTVGVSPFSPLRPSEAHGINASGEIVGFGEPANPGGLFRVHAILWRDGAAIDLGALGGDVSRAWGINEDGVVVGSATITGDYFFHPFMWQDGVMTDLGMGSGDAFGIDPTGRVVGRRGSLSGGFRAFLWEQGAVTDLGTLGGTMSAAYAINPAGVIVGSSLTAKGVEHAFRWHNGTMTDLGTLGGERSVAKAISPAGDIVGSSTTASGEEHAVLWPKGAREIIDLGTFGRSGSVATGINPSGQIVGSVSGAPSGTPSTEAFIWQRGVMTLLPGAFTSAAQANRSVPAHGYAINPAGDLVGDARTIIRGHAALWSRK